MPMAMNSGSGSLKDSNLKTLFSKRGDSLGSSKPNIPSSYLSSNTSGSSNTPTGTHLLSQPVEILCL
jgi:hypothetical protein